MAGFSDSNASGAIVRQSWRVANLAHFLTRNARRFPERAGFIWGERSWTWREIDAGVSALAGEKCSPFVVRVSYANDQIAGHCE